MGPNLKGREVVLLEGGRTLDIEVGGEAVHVAADGVALVRHSEHPHDRHAPRLLAGHSLHGVPWGGTIREAW